MSDTQAWGMLPREEGGKGRESGSSGARRPWERSWRVWNLGAEVRERKQLRAGSVFLGVTQERMVTHGVEVIGLKEARAARLCRGGPRRARRSRWR